MKIRTVARKEAADVLVLGAGGAAIRAAIAAAEFDPDLSVLIATKGEFGKSGVTANACSDRMAFHATLPTTEPGGPDAWRHHADDTYRIGGYVSDYDLAEVQARNAAQAFAYLDELGVPWGRRPDGTVDQFVTDGSKYARACYTGPYTANDIEAALAHRTGELGNIRVLDGVCATDLLVGDDGAIAGALLVEEAGTRKIAITAGAVVLATGGAGQIYEVSVFTPDATGDGYAMAYRAGAEIVNMEFIQIGLCSTATKLAMSGSMMRALPRLINDRGEEFLRRYLPASVSDAEMYGIFFSKGASWPVSYEEPSHVIDIAVSYERASGRRVFLDYSCNPQNLHVSDLPHRVRYWYEQARSVPLEEEPYRSSPLMRLRHINLPSVQWLAERGVDLERGDVAEIAPAIQHFQGGVKIRPRADTTIPGLFAAGEVAGGQHGANRPGGNALMDGQVFGRIAGENAAKLARQRRAKISPDSLKGALAALAQLEEGGQAASEVRERVQRLMAENAAVVRTAGKLSEAIAELAAITGESFGTGDDSLAFAVETRNAVQVAEMVLRAALARDESRGPHLRFAAFGDLEPVSKREAWNRYIIIRRDGQRMLLEPRLPVAPATA